MSNTKVNNNHIIITEDDKGLNRLIAKKLKCSGYQTKSFFNASETIESFYKNKHQLLLLDYYLPDMDCKQLIMKLKKRHHDCNFIVITGNGDEELAVEMMKLGALDYVVKDNNFLNILPHKIKQVMLRIEDKIALKSAQERLKENEQRKRKFLNSAIDSFIHLDANLNIVDINNKGLEIWRLTRKETIGKHITDLFPKLKNKERYNQYLKVMKTGKPLFSEEVIHPAQFGEIIFSVRVFKVDNGLGIAATDITETKKNERIQTAIYNVSRAIFHTENMTNLYEQIRDYLGKVIDTTNFYIALYDAYSDSIFLPYNIDQYDNYTTFPAGKTLTKYVIDSGKPLLGNHKQIEKLEAKGLIETIGEPAKVWLGVPLKLNNKVIGVIAVQSYKNENAYDEDDEKILKFISEQIALSFAKKKTRQNLKKVKKRLETANSMLRHDIANNLSAINSALRIFKKTNNSTMLTEIKGKINSSIALIEKQKKQEKFLNSHLSLKEISLNKVLKDIEQEFPNIVINTKGEGMVYADEAIHSVFRNLINNAVNHGKTKKIDIEIETKKNDCIIKFIDYGKGIPDNIKKKIFNKGFTHGKSGNTGIGLFIVKQTIKEFGGSLVVADNKPEGTIFTIKLRSVMNK